MIVDVGAWALDRELTYLVPEKLSQRISVGSIVRVPLRNRRVRGWVVALGEEDRTDSSNVTGDFLPIASLSGRRPVFDEALLEVARRLARRYVQPLSSFLSLFTPPRLGRAPKELSTGVPGPSTKRKASLELVLLAPYDDAAALYSTLIESTLAEGKSAIVVVPEVREGSAILGQLAERFRAEAALVHTGLDPAQRSAALWSAADGKRRLILGGRAAVFAPVFSVGAIVVHQEHDPSLKEQRAPYYDAREVAWRRIQSSGGKLLMCSATPSMASIARVGFDLGSQLAAGRARHRSAWPAVEVVEVAKRGIPRRAIAAIIEARQRREKVLMLLPRTKATRAGPGPEELSTFVARVVPGSTIARADRPGMGIEPGRLRQALQADVVIATEAGLAEIERPPIAVGIALGVDAYFQRPSGAASEQAFAALWTLAGLASGRSPRGKLILETANSHHHVVQALARGDYRYFARFELQTRAENETPPCKVFARLQVQGEPGADLLEQLRSLPGTELLGPVPGGKLGSELLLKMDKLEPVLDPLGTIVRGSSQRVLVEMDPRDW